MLFFFNLSILEKKQTVFSTIPSFGIGKGSGLASASSVVVFAWRLQTSSDVYDRVGMN